MTRLTGDQIRDGRYTKKMTTRQLAKELGVTMLHLSSVEHGRAILTDEQYAKASEVLGVKARVSERSCIGTGGTFEEAIKSALNKRREAEFDDHVGEKRLVIDQHYIEPWRSYHHMFGASYGHRHVVVLRRARGHE